MKPAPFRHHAPRTLAEALDLLAALDGARPLAGGQSLVPQLNARLITAPHLVDLNKVAGLDGIEEGPGLLRIGAMVRQSELLRAPAIRRHTPVLAEALTHVGHLAVRNRGTIGGSLCQLDPWAELPLAALLLGAEMELSHAAGPRRLAFADFVSGGGRAALRPGEILTHIRLPIGVVPPRQGFAEVADRPNDPAEALAAASLLLQEGRVTAAAIAVAGPLPTPVRLPEVEAWLAGRTAKPELAQDLPPLRLDLGPDQAAVLAVALRRAIGRALA